MASNEEILPLIGMTKDECETVIFTMADYLASNSYRHRDYEQHLRRILESPCGNRGAFQSLLALREPEERLQPLGIKLDFIDEVYRDESCVSTCVEIAGKWFGLLGIEDRILHVNHCVALARGGEKEIRFAEPNAPVAFRSNTSSLGRAKPMLNAHVNIGRKVIESITSVATRIMTATRGTHALLSYGLVEYTRLLGNVVCNRLNTATNEIEDLIDLNRHASVIEHDDTDVEFATGFSECDVDR